MAVAPPALIARHLVERTASPPATIERHDGGAGDVTTGWRNRIVRSGDAPLAEITANPKNWRGDGSTIERIQVERYHRFKAENGSTADEIGPEATRARRRPGSEYRALERRAPPGAASARLTVSRRWENVGAWLAVKSSLTMAPRGRPSKYTPQAVKRIVDALSAGNSRKASSAYGGISEATFGSWLANFRDFREAVKARRRWPRSRTSRTSPRRPATARGRRRPGGSSGAVTPSGARSTAWRSRFAARPSGSQLLRS